MGNQDKISDYIKASREIGLQILPPDINQSCHDFTAEAKGEVRYGLKAIKNVGSAAISALIKAREEKEFSSLLDFLKRVDISAINVQSLEAFIKAGAFDQIAVSRASLLLNYEDLYNKYNNLSKHRAQGQQSFAELFEDQNEFMEEDLNYTEVDELKTETILEQEKEFLGIYLSAHPLDQYQEKLKYLKTYSLAEVIDASEGQKVLTAAYLINYKEHITKRNNKMAFLTVSDRDDKIEVIVFSDLFRKINFDLRENKGLLIYGEKSDGQLIAKKIISLNQKLLLMNISELSQRRIAKLKRYLLKKEGNVPVLLKRNNKLIITADKYNIDSSQQTHPELSRAMKKSEYKFL
jgi:DNA polymerase-3 subunit alpha